MRLRIVTAAMLAALGYASVHRADAAVVVTMLEVGSDVVMSGGGTIDTDGIPFSSTAASNSLLFPSFRAFIVGPSNFTTFDFYAPVSGPDAFGLGQVTVASSGTGDRFGLLSGLVAVPEGYASGAALSGTAIFTGANFASLGVSVGTYVWAWGSGADADTLTLQILPTAAVPAPASALLLGIGAAAVAVGRARRPA